MTHLFVDLYDRPDDNLPCCTLDDQDIHHRQYFYDLHRRGMAGRAARLVMRLGDEYHTGDHIRLLDQVKSSDTDTVVLDPAIANDVDLNDVIFDDRGFADRAEAILMIISPRFDNSFRMRISLFDKMGQSLPSLIFYDWELPQTRRLTDLDHFHFKNKAAFIRIEPGPNYQPGDRVILRESLEPNSRRLALKPGAYNLHQIYLLQESRRSRWSLSRAKQCWADTVAGLELNLQPRVVVH